jgi:hypothetical protein
MALHPPSDDPPPLRRVTGNAFLVLEQPTSASPQDIESATQRLLTALERGLPAAQRYSTPVGPRLRDAGTVEEAAETLRDPDRRVVHELWAEVGSEPYLDETPSHGRGRGATCAVRGRRP